jgi:transposase
MALPSYIPVKESIKELKSLLKTSTILFHPRIKMLIAMQKVGDVGISKRALMDAVVASSQSIQDWRTLYKNGGIEALLCHKMKGNKPSVFTKEEHQKIEAKLKDAKNPLRGFKELNEWIIEEFKKEVKYNTTLKYTIKNFGASVKVARKSHIKKDEEAVETFKKTLVESVKKPLIKKNKSSRV